MQFYPSGTRIANRYEVAGRPLTGGMGVVYLCFDHTEQRPVALKTFKPEFLPDRAARERFLEEGNTWVRLGRHPHIVHAYTVERIGDGREVYLVLELVAKEEGRRDASLRSWLTPGQPLPADQALLITLQIVRGMRHAAETIPGFVHRDLKPENVLVGADRLSNSAINRVRVTDFGLVKGLRAERVNQMQGDIDLASRPGQLTRAGSVLGTPPYMAPEQWEGSDVTLQTDIYAVGCILGEMLTGRMLVQGGTLDELWQAHQGGQALVSAQSAADPAVWNLLTGCPTVAPGLRHRDWTILEDALSEVYSVVTGGLPPKAESGAALNRAEQVANGWSYKTIGSAYLDLGYAERAVPHFELALEVGRREGERQLEAAALDTLGNAHTVMGSIGRAITHYAEALHISREIGDRRGQGIVLGDLGTAYRAMGDAHRALDYLSQALQISRETGDRHSECADLINLGVTHLDLHDPQRAFAYFKQALALAQAIDDRRGEGICLGELGNLYASQGDLKQGIDYFEQALAISRELGNRRGEGTNLTNLGLAYASLGDLQPAIGFYEQAAVIHQETRNRHSLGMVLGHLGDACMDMRDSARATSYYERASAVLREIGDLRGLALAANNLAMAYVAEGDVARGLDQLQQSAQLFEQTGDSESAGRVRQWIEELEDPSTAISREPVEDEVLRNFGPLIEDVIAATQGNWIAQWQVENVLDATTQNGWVVADPIRRIWAGERDLAALTAGIDPNSARIIREILRRL